MGRWQIARPLLNAGCARFVVRQMRAGVALGSNLGDRLENLRAARKAIVVLWKKTVFGSAIYETDPVDCEPDANKFLNAVLEFEFDGDAIELLQKLKQIEVSV